MTPEQFLILNFLLVVGFVGLFFWGRSGGKSPTLLKLTMSKKAQDFEALPSKPHRPSLGRGETLGELQSQHLKEVNPIFVYNGHTWDAYEVLGLIPGSSLEAIREAFDRAIQKSDRNSHDFYKVALTTILNEIKKYQRG